MADRPCCYWKIRFALLLLLLLVAGGFVRFQAGMDETGQALGAAAAAGFLAFLTVAPRRWGKAFFSLGLVLALGVLAVQTAEVDLGLTSPSWWEPPAFWPAGFAGFAYAVALLLATYGLALGICGFPLGRRPLEDAGQETPP